VKKTISILKNGGVGVLPTDTLYGIVGSALSKRAVLRIYKLRRRDPKKPMIILIGSLDDLKLFGVKLDKAAKKFLREFWPGKISVVLPCPYDKFSYLHRGTKTLAFRLPKLKWLRVVLEKTGPLVAPSANQEGLKPAKTAKEAREYFGDEVDFYIKKGRLVSLPSTLIAFKNGEAVVLRRGAAKIKV